MFSNITHLSVSRRISSRFCLLSSLRRSKSSMIYFQVQINPPNQTEFEKERERRRGEKSEPGMEMKPLIDRIVSKYSHVHIPQLERFSRIPKQFIKCFSKFPFGSQLPCWKLKQSCNILRLMKETDGVRLKKNYLGFLESSSHYTCLAK